MNEQLESWLPVAGISLTVGPVVLILAYFFYINNCADTRDKRTVLFKSKPYDIRSVAINAGRSSNKRPTKSLITEGQTVTDAKTVAEVMDALATAVEGNPPRGMETWIAVLHVTHARREVSVEVIAFDGGAVWLYLKSGGDSGWNLGTYQCQPLGPVLEKLTGFVRKPVEGATEPAELSTELPAESPDNP